jgi:hypothetical protein
MLADGTDNIQLGRLDPDIHLPATSKLAILDFIAGELPVWRNFPDRRKEQAETVLTEQLCEYLNRASRLSDVWSYLQFRTETVDENQRGRKVDLTVKPLTRAIVIAGRRHTIFDAILPIECKRLPTPAGTDRDEREYVFNRHASTGGIERFKRGLHGGSHALAAMIGYVQQESCEYWSERVIEWINDLVASGQKGWTMNDLPSVVERDTLSGTAALKSSHAREGIATSIELRHLWIQIT